jgi:ABC-type phosphate/phosphonate transport system substrate-binding protein
MKAFSLTFVAAVLAVAQAILVGPAVAAEPSTTHSTAPPLMVIVMDPLALPLSCPCVKGYAQRDYDQLGKYLEGRLHFPVRVVFSETVREALDKKTGGRADLVIGKDSVVRRQTKRAGIGVAHVAALTGLDGKTTQTGLWVVPAKDPAISISDIKGYRIILGSEDCDEKNLAAQNLMVDMGLPKIKKPETCSACSDGATRILALFKEGTKSATVISSYAKPLLEGCGTIKKGDLRVIGETESVPFVAAFVNDKLPPSTREAIQTALLDVAHHPKLCKSLETKLGFVMLDQSNASAHVAAKKN